MSSINFLKIKKYFNVISNKKYFKKHYYNNVKHYLDKTSTVNTNNVKHYHDKTSTINTL